MWLLDVNVDARVAAFLAECGVRAENATDRGWRGLTNGDLVASAVQNGFTCLVTRDAGFREAASQALAVCPEFSVVVITLRQKPQAAYMADFRAAWSASPILPHRGGVVYWP